MKKLKICIVSLRSLPLFDSGYDSENVIGGAEVNMFNLALCLSGIDNVAVRVVVDDFGQPPHYKVGNIELIRFSKNVSSKGWLKRKITSLLAYIKLFLLNADAFLFTTSNRLLGILVLFHRIIRRKKVLFRLSSDSNADLVKFKGQNGRFNYFLYRFGLNHASAIISQTMKQKTLLKQKLGIDSEVIENGFFPRQKIKAENKKYILWVGRCMESKKPMKFLELAGSLPDEQFVMIMPTNKDIPENEKIKRHCLAESIKNEAQRLINLKLIEYVPFHKIQEYYDKAKIYVCTSELEGFPNTFIQACLGGTPILSYSVNPSNMIGEYHLGCFCDNDYSKAVEFIKSMSKAKLKDYMAYLRYYVSDRHNIHSTTQKYLELINKDFAEKVSFCEHTNKIKSLIRYSQSRKMSKNLKA